MPSRYHRRALGLTPPLGSLHTNSRNIRCRGSLHTSSRSIRHRCSLHIRHLSTRHQCSLDTHRLTRLPGYLIPGE